MQLNEFMQSCANEIGGNYAEYDDKRSVVIVPLKDKRLQTVIAEKDEQEGRVNVSSKICESSQEFDAMSLLVEHHDRPYCKFAISDSFLKVESTLNTVHLDEELLKKVIIDIANIADEWEYKITGKDVF